MGVLIALQKQGMVRYCPTKDKKLCSMNNWQPLT